MSIAALTWADRYETSWPTDVGSMSAEAGCCWPSCIRSTWKPPPWALIHGHYPGKCLQLLGLSPNQVASGASDGQLHTCRTDTSRRITLTVKAVWVKENPCLFLLLGHLRLCIAFLTLASTSSCQTEQKAHGRRAKFKVSLLLFFHSPLVLQASSFIRVPSSPRDYKYLQLITVKISCFQQCHC